MGGGRQNSARREKASHPRRKPPRTNQRGRASPPSPWAGSARRGPRLAMGKLHAGPRPIGLGGGGKALGRVPALTGQPALDATRSVGGLRGFPRHAEGQGRSSAAKGSRASGRDALSRRD